MHSIAFRVEVEQILDSQFDAQGVETPVTVQVLHAVALVDGDPLFNRKQSDIDVSDLLETAKLPSGTKQDFTLLTCSCGIPGCAGYHDDPQVEITDELVRWHLPCEGYQRVMAPKLGPGPWVLTFDRAQYVQAIAQLAEQLASMQQARKEQGTPCCVFPGQVGPEFELAPFDEA